MNNFGIMGELERNNKETINITVPDFGLIIEETNSFDLGTVIGVNIQLNTFVNGWDLQLEENGKVIDISGEWDNKYEEKLCKIFIFKPELHVAMFEIYELLKNLKSEFTPVGRDKVSEKLIRRITTYYGKSYSVRDDANSTVLEVINVDDNIKYIDECIEHIKLICGDNLISIYNSTPNIIVVLK